MFWLRFWCVITSWPYNSKTYCFGSQFVFFFYIDICKLTPQTSQKQRTIIELLYITNLSTLLTLIMHELTQDATIFLTMAQQPPSLPMGQVFLTAEDTRSHSDTPHSVGLLWTSDQPVAETSIWQHTTLTTDRHPCSLVGFEPTISVSERSQTHALDREATGTGSKIFVSFGATAPIGPGPPHSRDF